MVDTITILILIFRNVEAWDLRTILFAMQRLLQQQQRRRRRWQRL
jgi:hypothetical protein